MFLWGIRGPAVIEDEGQPPEPPSGNLLAANWADTERWHMDGYYFLRPYDMRNDFGSHGIAVSDAIGGGMRYLWLVSSDHKGGDYTHQYGGGIHAGWSDDPAVLPRRFKQFIQDNVDFNDPLVDDNHAQIETPWLVYNPDDLVTGPFYLFVHGNAIGDGDHGQETCLIRSTDFVTWVPDKVTHYTGVSEPVPPGYEGPHGIGTGSYSGPGPGGHTGYQQIIRSGTGDWESYGLSSNGAFNFGHLGKFTSTDGREFTLMRGELDNDIGVSPDNRSFSQLRSPRVTIGGELWTLSSEDARNVDEGQFTSFIPVKANGDLGDDVEADIIRISESVAGTYPDLTYQAAVSGFAEDGIYLGFTTRGFYPDNGRSQMDLYGFVYDQALAQEAAPMGVRASCAAGVVTLQWYNIQPGATYRVYRSNSSNPAGAYTLVGTVTTASFEDNAGDLDALRYYRVVKLHGGNEHGERRVGQWVSNGSVLCNAHIGRVAMEGGDTATVDPVWLEAVIAWLANEGLTDKVMQWTDARFGVDTDGSHIAAGNMRVFDLAATINGLNSGDLMAVTSGFSRDANLFGAGKAGITSSATSNLASWSWYMFNNVRRRPGLTGFAGYSRVTATTHEIAFITTGGDNNFFRIGRLSGSPGNVYVRVTESLGVVVSVPHAASQTNNTLIGVWDGTQIWLMENGNQSAASSVATSASLTGKTGNDVNDRPALGYGAEALKHRLSLNQWLSSNNKCRFNCMSVGLFGVALTALQATSLHNLLDGEMA